MRCPFCKEDKDKVVDSRSGEKGRVIRRRRECLVCHRRFTTYERIEETIKLMVVKKDGSRVPFDRQRIVAGVQKACYKRPISAQKIDELARDVEEEIVIKFSQEVSSEVIGNLTIARLRNLDKVAYIRYASVYREFDDLAQFLDEVQGAMEFTDDSPGQNQLF